MLYLQVYAKYSIATQRRVNSLVKLVAQCAHFHSNAMPYYQPLKTPVKMFLETPLRENFHYFNYQIVLLGRGSVCKLLGPSVADRECGGTADAECGGELNSLFRSAMWGS